jgi:hypothetical protein
MTIRTPVSRRPVAIAIACVGASLLSGTLATPIANADDPLGPIRGTVNGDRSRTACPAFNYSQELEDLAQTAVRPGDARGGDLSGYHGKAKLTTGWGDPQAAAINDAYKKGAGAVISDCSYTDFGVGFHRDDSSEYDSVSIVFGTPDKAAAPPAAAPAPDPILVPTPASRQCPAGSPTPTVGAFETCAPPPTDSVTLAVSAAGRGKIDVKLTNSADLDASCAYTAKPTSNPFGILPTINKTVAVKAKGTATLNENSPLPGSTYHLTVSCTGSFDGKNVDLGHPEQDVSG